jgi:hypothetical protein
VDTFANTAREMSEMESGAAAVNAADASGGLAAANAPAPAMSPTMMPTMTVGGSGEGAPQQAQQINPLQTVGDKTFLWQDGVWTDTTFEPDTMTTQKVAFLSDEYFALLESNPALSEYFALGDRVIVVVDSTAFEVTTDVQ